MCAIIILCKYNVGLDSLQSETYLLQPEVIYYTRKLMHSNQKLILFSGMMHVLCAVSIYIYTYDHQLSKNTLINTQNIQ